MEYPAVSEKDETTPAVKEGEVFSMESVDDTVTGSSIDLDVR